MIGSVLSILGGQVQITAVTSPTLATVTVLSRLPDTVVFAGIDPTGFVVGEVASTTIIDLKIEIINVGATTVTGPLMNGRIMAGTAADTLSSPTASCKTTGWTLFSGTTSTVQWSEEFMSATNGWPAAVGFGNDRFIFCQFPQRQEAILWTAVGTLTNAYIDSAAAQTDQSAGASPSSAILEFLDGRPKVLNVVDTGDEFVFTDHGVYFIPLAVSGIALEPGTVRFRQITNDGCSPVRPIPLLQMIIYANAAGNRISVVRATGALTLPYSSDDMTDVHSDLFKAPICIAVSSGDASPERLAYVVNSDMSLVVGRFSRETGAVGWHPESGLSQTAWVTTDIESVWYNSVYPSGTIVEIEDVTQLLDCVLPFNAPPANMVAAGLGPFWWLAGSTITVAENGLDLGDRGIDQLGNIVTLQGDVLADAAMIGGAPISKAWQPVIPRAAPGQSRKQRMRRRSIKNAMIVVEANCEFDWGDRRVPAYDFGDDATQPPAFEEQSIRSRPLGRAYSPTIALTSSRFGQIRLKEFAAEVTA